jgi:hypothetical protein
MDSKAPLLVVQENKEIMVRQQHWRRRYFAVAAKDALSFATSTQPKFERSSADDDEPVYSLHQVVDCRELLLPSSQ